jgi:hypothetical protein
MPVGPLPAFSSPSASLSDASHEGATRPLLAAAAMFLISPAFRGAASPDEQRSSSFKADSVENYYPGQHGACSRPDVSGIPLRHKETKI